MRCGAESVAVEIDREPGVRKAAPGQADSGLLTILLGAPRGALTACLGDVQHGPDQAGAEAVEDHPRLRSALGWLHGPNLERWQGARRSAMLNRGAFRLAHDGEHLFGVACLRLSGGEDLASATEALYTDLLASVRELAYPNLIRIWNHVPDINRLDAGLERYRRFCIGRHSAFAALGPGFEARLPAATAVGGVGETLQVVFVAGRDSVRFLESPRQVSAYRYPPEHGPRSPSFARASLVRGAADRLYISGTASIAGHVSLHPGDVLAQLDETLHNLEALLAHANQRAGTAFSGLSSLSAVKVYLRHREDLPEVRAKLEARLHAAAAVMYLQADICRRELLIEIEAIAEA